MSDLKRRVAKEADEVFAGEAAMIAQVSEATFRRWINAPWVPSKVRIGGVVVKRSAAEKVKAARTAHDQHSWMKKITWTDAEKFAEPIQMDLLSTEAKSISKPGLFRGGISVHTNPRSSELATIARRLMELGESEVAAQVAIRACAAM